MVNMFHRLSLAKVVALKKLFLFALFIHSNISSAMEETLIGDGLLSEHKCNLQYIESNHFSYTPSFRPEAYSEVKVISQPLDIERTPMLSQELMVYGGVALQEDERSQVTDVVDKHWSVNGMLTMKFDNKVYTSSGTLISPLHVLTTGRTLFDPKGQKWATDIEFHPGRTGESLLATPIKCSKKAVFSSWKFGDEKSDMGIVELNQDCGRVFGYNGLLCCSDEFLLTQDPINVTGYPFSKPVGTLWTDFSKQGVNQVSQTQFTYTLSATEGQAGASAWVRNPKNGPEGFYSLGVHAYGLALRDSPKVNVATRITQGKILAIVDAINNKF